MGRLRLFGWVFLVLLISENAKTNTTWDELFLFSSPEILAQEYSLNPSFLSWHKSIEAPNGNDVSYHSGPAGWVDLDVKNVMLVYSSHLIYAKTTVKTAEMATHSLKPERKVFPLVAYWDHTTHQPNENQWIDSYTFESHYKASFGMKFKSVCQGTSHSVLDSNGKMTVQNQLANCKHKKSKKPNQFLRGWQTSEIENIGNGMVRIIVWNLVIIDRGKSRVIGIRVKPPQRVVFKEAVLAEKKSLKDVFANMGYAFP